MIDRLASRRWIVPVIAVAAAGFLLPLAIRPTWFPFAPAAEYSDALVAHLSSAAFLRRSMATWGQIPLWNPTILAGMPFAADPLSGLWYPPFWLLAAFPRALTINLLAWFHIALAGVGMFLLLRSETLGRGAALVGALAFAGMPKLVGHVGLGHMGLVAAVAWTPWVLLAAGNAVARVGGARSARRFIACGATLGAAFLADPRWILPLAVSTLAYAATRGSGAEGRPGHRTRLLLGVAAAAAAALALTAVAALPFLEFASLTTRSALGASGAAVFALPAARLLGLLVADRGGWAEWLVSMGSTALVLAVVGASGWRRGSRFWAVATIVALLLALGPATPLGQAFGALPGVDLLRVPARWLFLAGLGVAGLAGHGVEVLNEPDGRPRRRARLGALLAGGTILGVSLVMSAVTGIQISVALSALAAILATVFTRVLDRAGRLVWGGGLFAILIIVELAWIDASLIEPRSPEAAMQSGARVVEAIGDPPDSERVYSPSYSVPQDVAAFEGLELADGIHPLQLSRYVRFMGAASGMDTSSYSVSLPPFEDGNPSVDWGPTLDAYRLGLLAVTKIVAAYPVVAEGIELERASDGLWIYTNLAARPRAWVEPSVAQGILDVEAFEWSPNRVRVTAQGPGRLVLSDIDYPGWHAMVGGRAAEIEPYQSLLRSVEIPEGRQEVVFTFQPASLMIGLALSLGALAVVVVLWRRA